jgi:RNase P/RNase MRP subunit p30
MRQRWLRFELSKNKGFRSREAAQMSFFKKRRDLTRLARGFSQAMVGR